MKFLKNDILLFVVILAVILCLVAGYMYISSDKNRIQDNFNYGNTQNGTEIEDVVNDIVSEVEFTDNDQYEIEANTVIKDLKLIDKSVTINEGGIYRITGAISNGCILIDSLDEVHLILDGCTIKSADGPAINIQSAKNVVISLNENTVNTIEDSNLYSNLDEDEEPNATIFSKDDLIINGKGTLNVVAKYNNGITCKDSLKIVDSNISITSVNHGINGKDYLALKNCTLNILSNGDAIRSSKGEVVIDSGTYIFNAQEDGIQAETNVIINNGNFKIITGEGSANASIKSDSGKWGQNMQIETTTEDISSKGIKAQLGIIIQNGTLEIDSLDDSIHSNGKVIINNGNISVNAGDDGIHADSEIGINGGNINILKSYEGIESVRIDISGGNIKIIAKDDGINIAGGNDSSSLMGRPGQNAFNNNTVNTNNILTINDGTINIDAVGDGIDVNGSAFVNGGTIFISGPTNNGNAALDYDNTFKIDGGVFVAAGSKGMLQSVSNSSLQYTITIAFDNQQIANSEIAIKDKSGNMVLSYAPIKEYQSVILSTPSFKKGEMYIAYVDNVEIGSVTIADINSNIGNIRSGGGMMNPNRGDPSVGIPVDKRQRN